jgi:amidase
MMGLVGMRSTIALISRRGVVPVSLTMDTTGPMTRTVTDFAMMLNVMAGSDSGDPWSTEADAHRSDYTARLNTDALKGVRLGVYRGNGGYSDVTRAVFEEALQVLVAQGAELIELPSDIIEDMNLETRMVMYYDIKEDMAAYLANAPAAVKVRTLGDIVAFNKADPRENIHGQEHLEAAALTEGGRKNADYIKTLEYAQRRAGPEGYGKAMTDHNVSAIVAVNQGPAGVLLPDGTAAGGPALDRPKGETPPSISGNAAIAGYPNLTVPMGHIEGMPVGLSFVGPKWSEQMLLAYGYAYEQATKKRVAPTGYKDTVGAK